MNPQTFGIWSSSSWIDSDPARHTMTYLDVLTQIVAAKM